MTGQAVIRRVRAKSKLGSDQDLLFGFKKASKYFIYVLCYSFKLMVGSVF